MRLFGRRDNIEREWAVLGHDPEFKKLAEYNAECARGILHTVEWDNRMTEAQIRFDTKVRDLHAADPNTVHIR
jgi:hypothetical protein